jgi:fatty-acyl-CoA synthase
VDALDAEELADFLAIQEDLGTKWAPRFVRMTPALPVTATNKVLKRGLRAERWTCDDPVLWKPAKDEPYRRLDEAEAAALERAVADRVL